MDRTYTKDFLREFDDSAYPDSFLYSYEVMECLAKNLNVDTFLVRHRQTGEFRIAKCSGDPMPENENHLLENLHHDALPKYIEEHKNANMRCTVYEYVQGLPLGSLCAERMLDEKSILSIMTQLCDVLIYLHGQSPPVIHRDIKPQNIIVEDSGKVRLIDFGISREYDASALKDTVYAGTQDFAPPEQFGFSQTDCRSDIYSMGVLLRWLLIGSADDRKEVLRIKKSQFAAVVKKCTAFSPKDRYSNAKRLKKAILKADRRARTRPYRPAAAVFALLLFTAAGFILGRYTDIGQAVQPTVNTARFSEPVIERAVRLALGKGDDEPLTKQELSSVTSLYIFGNEPAENEEAYNALGEQFFSNGSAVQRGTITRLNDIVKLPNLKVLCMAYQSIEDLSPLSACANLERIDLKHNPISDVSPLSGLKPLEALVVFDTNVSDMSALKDCPCLTIVDAGDTLIESFSAFNGLTRLREIVLRGAPLQTLAGINTHAYLEKLYISHTDVLDLLPLLELTRLKILEVSGDMRTAADAVSADADFEICYSG